MEIAENTIGSCTFNTLPGPRDSTGFRGSVQMAIGLLSAHEETKLGEHLMRPFVPLLFKSVHGDNVTKHNDVNQSLCFTLSPCTDLKSNGAKGLIRFSTSFVSSCANIRLSSPFYLSSVPVFSPLHSLPALSSFKSSVCEKAPLPVWLNDYK